MIFMFLGTCILEGNCLMLNALHDFTQVFFYKAQVVSGSPSVNDSKSDIKDFVWLKREELSDKLHPEYYEKLSNCLIDEF